jgi:hypothetical protein
MKKEDSVKEYYEWQINNLKVKLGKEIEGGNRQNRISMYFVKVNRRMP